MRLPENVTFDVTYKFGKYIWSTPLQKYVKIEEGERRVVFVSGEKKPDSPANETVV